MTSAAVNNTAAGKAPLNNKTLGIGMAAFAVIEAVVTFFLVMKPLFINPVFNQCKAYNEEGKACIVKLFGKTFASQDEIANNQIILSLWDTILNIVLIYIVITGILLLLSFCYFKGFAFAKSYLIAVFGAKTVIALTPILVPFANFRNSIRTFGAIDAVICLAACIYCVYDSSSEYADDMLLTADNIANMWKRGKTAGVMFLIMAAAAIFAAFGMSAYGNIGNSGGNWSIVIGWLDNTSLAQGVVLILLVAVALIGSIIYVREGEWAMIYYFSFGAAMTVTNLIGILFRILWIFKTYNPTKALAKSGDEDALAWVGSNGMTAKWWMATVFLILSFVAAAVVTIIAFTKIKSKLSFKFSEADKKPAIAVMIGAGSIILEFVLTMIAVLMWDKQHYTAITLGAMDYMYFITFGGISLFLAIAMWSGYGFSKFGTLALYIMVGSCNFSSIFTVFGERGTKVANSLAAYNAAVEQGLTELPAKFKGYNYITCGVFFILSFLVCFSIIVVFVVKEVNNYMYQKRYE